ncbi:MAG: hypothetical protein R2712_15415 [Vicinamibacterales bacterium]
MAFDARPSVMIGDSPVDAARRGGGCDFVLAAYGFGAAKFAGRDVPGLSPAAHPRELVSLTDTRTLDAARVPIVIR